MKAGVRSRRLTCLILLNKTDTIASSVHGIIQLIVKYSNGKHFKHSAEGISLTCGPSSIAKNNKKINPLNLNVLIL